MSCYGECKKCHEHVCDLDYHECSADAGQAWNRVRELEEENEELRKRIAELEQER